MTSTCQDEFGQHDDHKDCAWLLGQMSWGYDDEEYVALADGTVQIVPRERDQDDEDDFYYLSGSGERSDDDSYVQYLNNY